MALVGDLASVDLAQVFQVLSQTQKEGILEVYRGGQPQALRFRRGAVTLQFDRDVYEERAIELFRRLGRIDERKLHLAAANRAGSDAALLDVLVEMQILDGEDLNILFRERMAEEIYEFFMWNQGRFEFHEGLSRLDGAPGNVDDRYYFPADSVVMEAARRSDEWGRIRQRVHDPGAVFAPTVSELIPEDDLQAAVFIEIDGTRSVLDITQKIGRSSFEVHKTIARLAELNAIAAVEPENYPEHGRAARDAGRPREAANLYDLAVASNIDIPESYRLAAECWEGATEPALAADRFVAYGDALEDPGRALNAYIHAHALVPTHLEAWRKAVSIVLQMEEAGNKLRSAPSPHALAEIYIEIGEGEAGAAILEKIIHCHPTDLAAKRLLAGVLESTGNRKRQCELLESIGNDLVALGDAMGAAAAFQTVLRLQPDRRDISARIREFYKKDESKRARTKLATTIIVGGAILGSLGFYAYSREARARAELGTLEIDGPIQAGGFSAARSVLDAFRERNNYTFAVRDLDPLYLKIDEAEKASNARDRDRREQEQILRSGRLAEANALAKSATERVARGELGIALSELRRALSTAPPDWDQAAAARRNASDLDQYLTNAQRLGQELVVKTANKNYQAAREIVHELATKYSFSPEGAAARYPVEVTTDPPGAWVTLDGEMLKLSDGTRVTTPALLYAAPSKSPRMIQIERAGFTSASVAFDPAGEASLHITLGRSFDSVRPLKAPPSALAAVRDSTVYVPLPGARVASVGADESKDWIVSIASPGEILFTPHVDPSGIVVVTNDGTVAVLDPEDGHIVWYRALGVPARVPPAVGSRGFFVATDDNRVRLLDRPGGEVRSEWKLAGRPVGAVAVAEPALAVGLSDGRIQMIDMSSPRNEERTLKFGVLVAGMLFFDDVLVAAGDDGRITGFEWQTGRVLWDSPGGRIAAPRPTVVGERIVVDRGGRVTALDPHTGRVLATADQSLEPAGALAREGNRIIAALHDGSVVSLRAEDMSCEWRWPGLSGGALALKGKDIKGAVAPKAIPTVAASDTLAVAVVDGKIFRFEMYIQDGASSRPSSNADPEIR